MKIDRELTFALTLWGLAVALLVFAMACCVNPYKEYGSHRREDPLRSVAAGFRTILRHPPDGALPSRCELPGRARSVSREGEPPDAGCGP